MSVEDAIETINDRIEQKRREIADGEREIGIYMDVLNMLKQPEKEEVHSLNTSLDQWFEFAETAASESEDGQFGIAAVMSIAANERNIAVPPGTVRSRLANLVTEGRLERVKRGIYQISSNGASDQI